MVHQCNIRPMSGSFALLSSEPDELIGQVRSFLYMKSGEQGSKCRMCFLVGTLSPRIFTGIHARRASCEVFRLHRNSPCSPSFSPHLIGVQFNTANKGVVGTALGKGNDDLTTAIGCDRELLLDCRF